MTVISPETHPTAIHFAYRALFCGKILTFIPAMRRSSIVTSESELKHAATVPRLAAKILWGKVFLILEKSNFSNVSPCHKKSNEKPNVTKHVHDVKRHELINGINLTRFHWIAIFIMSKCHKAGIEVDQKHRDQSHYGECEGNFRFG